MRLAHLHLPVPIPYSHSLQLQEIILGRHLAYNNHVLQNARSSTTHPIQIAPHPPTLLTFQTLPVYTVGRRHLKTHPLSQTQIDFLTTNDTRPSPTGSPGQARLASFYPAPRGGLLTYHAPGQLTAYLMINLRTHGITPRCFIRLLETSVIKTCARHGVSNTMTTSDPGVWIGDRVSERDNFAQADGEACGRDSSLRATTRKVCAVGVHVTRGITTHGIGLNVFDTPIVTAEKLNSHTSPPQSQTDSQGGPGYLSWGFERITACGLEGKSVTWLAREGADAGTNLESVAYSLQQEVCLGLTNMGKINVEGVDILTHEELLANRHDLLAEGVDIAK